MSSRELERVGIMGRVDSGALQLKDAAAMLELSYRQVKRLWRRYRQVGGKGLQHGNAGRPSNRSKPQKLRRRVLNLIKKQYSGSEEERFGPTLAAEHLAEEDGIAIDHETLRCWMLAEGLWNRQRRRKKKTLPTKRAQSALWRTGAAGRELSRLAGAAWAAGMLDGHGR
jgi:transposase